MKKNAWSKARLLQLKHFMLTTRLWVQYQTLDHVTKAARPDTIGSSTGRMKRQSPHSGNATTSHPAHAKKEMPTATPYFCRKFVCLEVASRFQLFATRIQTNDSRLAPALFVALNENKE